MQINSNTIVSNRVNPQLSLKSKRGVFDLEKMEKRRFRRVGLRAAIRYQVRGVPEFDNAVSEDISEGGLAFSGFKFIPPFTPVMLEINLLSKMLHPIGKITWCQALPHSDRNRLGVEFLELDSSEKSYLSNYINMQSNKF